ncbi:MAG: hypothetical protein AAGC56_09040 [Pseudomonadota bacterium]
MNGAENRRGAGVAAPNADGAQTEPSPFTRNEGLVHAALETAGRPMKAYELLDLLHDAGLRAPMTIYRALEGLQAKGYAQKVVSQNAFVCVDRGARQHFRAIVTCRRCGDARLVPLSEGDVRAMLGVADKPIADVVVEAVSECDDAGCGKR